MEQNSWDTNISQSRNAAAFMQSVSSLLCLQVSVTDPCPKTWINVTPKVHYNTRRTRRLNSMSLSNFFRLDFLLQILLIIKIRNEFIFIIPMLSYFIHLNTNIFLFVALSFFQY